MDSTEFFSLSESKYILTNLLRNKEFSTIVYRYYFQ